MAYDPSTVDEWFNVLNFGAVGDGVTDDTAAFQATCNAAGAGGYVFAPAGKSYVLNGVLLTSTHKWLRVDVHGLVIVPPGVGSAINSAFILDNQATQIQIYINRLWGAEKATYTTIAEFNTNGHMCAGVTFGYAGSNKVYINYATALTEVVGLRPGMNISSSSSAGDNEIYIGMCENIYIVAHGVGGSAIGNHTQGTILRGRFWAVYAYGIKKDATVGAQNLWDAAGMAMDPFSNVDFVADISDAWGGSYYRLEFSTDTFVGNGFATNGQTILIDVVDHTALLFDTQIATDYPDFPDGWNSNLKLRSGNTGLPAIWFKDEVRNVGCIAGFGDGALEFGYEISDAIVSSSYLIFDFTVPALYPTVSHGWDLGSSPLPFNNLWCNGIVIGSPAGGNKGPGTINCTGLYVNGTAVTVP